MEDSHDCPQMKEWLDAEGEKLELATALLRVAEESLGDFREWRSRVESVRKEIELKLVY